MRLLCSARNKRKEHERLRTQSPSLVTLHTFATSASYINLPVQLLRVIIYPKEGSLYRRSSHLLLSRFLNDLCFISCRNLLLSRASDPHKSSRVKSDFYKTLNFYSIATSFQFRSSYCSNYKAVKKWKRRSGCGLLSFFFFK